MEAKLVVIGERNAGIEIPISVPNFLIGRGGDCQLRVRSNQISRRHCLIAISDSAMIEDCGSANGTLVNGEKVEGQRELHSGDRIGIGTLVLEVRLGGDKRPRQCGVNEAVILDWLEDGEEIEDEEKYWRKAAHHEEPVPEAKTDEIAAVAQEPREESPSYDVGMGEAILGGESPTMQDHPSSAAKTRLRKRCPSYPILPT